LQHNTSKLKTKHSQETIVW